MKNTAKENNSDFLVKAESNPESPAILLLSVLSLPEGVFKSMGTGIHTPEDARGKKRSRNSSAKWDQLISHDLTILLFFRCCQQYAAS